MPSPAGFLSGLRRAAPPTPTHPRHHRLVLPALILRRLLSHSHQANSRKSEDSVFFFQPITLSLLGAVGNWCMPPPSPPTLLQ